MKGHRPSNVKIAPAERRIFQPDYMGRHGDSHRYQDAARSGLPCGVRKSITLLSNSAPFPTRFHPSTQNQSDNRVSLSALISIPLIPGASASSGASELEATLTNNRLK